ncbi:uncharacterized protein [Triticum aestivum]|uniref:uncharacterized protein isoform X2 n=1 Tax=Triticum aestivum TaxID=4565 RepID=UPI001D027A4A|nr:uncharacterized protein LOC123104683 isoform X2 [Triticum aestivum]
MDTGAAPAPTTVSSDYFRLAYEASTSWMDSLAMESSGFITPTESTVLSQPQLRVYGAAAWKPVTSTATLYSPLYMYGLTPSRKGVFARCEIAAWWRCQDL